MLKKGDSSVHFVEMLPSAHCFLTAAMLLKWDEFISMMVNPSCAAHACTAKVLPVALLYNEIKGGKEE